MAVVYGRDDIRSNLRKLLTSNDGSLKVICIEGEPGIGKTLIADNLCNDDDVIAHYQHIHGVSGYDGNWDRIVRSLANAVLGEEHTKGTAEDLQQKIVNQAMGRKSYLLCIDNVDEMELIEFLRSYIGLWKAVPNGVLLLTGQKLAEFFSNDFCECITLTGLTDQDALEKLIGDRLCTLIRGDKGLWDTIRKATGGNPQKLLYLRWRAPKTTAELRQFLEMLDKDESEHNLDTAMEAIKTGLITLDIPIEHFLSIANLRHPVFSGTVLAFLWDRLGGGGSEYYERSLAHLLREGLLDVQKSNGAMTYRLNTTLHRRLLGAFEKLVSPERQAQIQFFLGDYFRARFAENYVSFLKERKEFGGYDKKEPFPIDDLDAYIKHTTDGGYAESAFRYLFSRGIIEWAHSAGSALGLLQILKTLCAAIENMLDQSQQPLGRELQDSLARLSDQAKTIIDDTCRRDSCALPGTVRYHVEGIKSSIPSKWTLDHNTGARTVGLEAMATVVHAALGRTYKDLNEHDKALGHLEIAKQKLEDKTHKDGIESKLGELGARRLVADLYHYMGIVYSVTARSAQCLEAYFDGIKYAAEHQCFTSRDALSLGYLAYELKFFDCKAALTMAEDSVEMARLTNDDIVRAKNLCTKGQIESFQQNWEKGKSSFLEAEIALAKKDDREFCRIKVDSAVTDIYKRNFTPAISVLEEVTKSYGKTGDPRRIAMARAYLGLIECKTGTTDEGIKILLEAYHDHMKIGTRREAIYEAMTILWMQGSTTFPSGEGGLETDLRAIPKQTGDLDEIIEFLIGLRPEELVYVGFWHHHYLPTLIIGT